MLVEAVVVVLLVVAVETVLSRNRATEGPEQPRSGRVKGKENNLLAAKKKSR